MYDDIRRRNPEKYYSLYAKLPVFQRKIDFAKKIIKEALALNLNWAIAVSGGKDSTVMLDLCIQCGWKGSLFHFFYKETPTENTNLCKLLAEQYDLQLDLVEVPGAFDVYEKCGFFLQAVTDEQNKETRKMLREYKKVTDEFTISQKYGGLFIGLRKDESRVRAITLSKKGLIYQTKNRQTKTCCPIGYMGAKEIWAYIFKQRLPYLTIYDKSENREKQRSELTWLDTESLWRYGQGGNFKKMFPEQWNEYIKKWPELSRQI